MGTAPGEVVLATYDSSAPAGVRDGLLRTWRERDVVRLIVARELRVRYRRSLLGVWWTLITPMLEMLVLLAVFSQIFRFSTPDAPYVVYLLSGLVLASVLRTTVVGVASSMGVNASLLARLNVPAEIFAVATAIELYVTALVSLVPLIVIMLAVGPGISATSLLAIIPMALLSIFCLGVGMALAPGAVRFPDIVVILGVLLTFATYLAPVMYPERIVPPRFQILLEINPLSHYLELFRSLLYEGSVGSRTDWLISTVLSTVSIAAGMLAFAKAKHAVLIDL